MIHFEEGNEEHYEGVGSNGPLEAAILAPRLEDQASGHVEGPYRGILGLVVHDIFDRGR
jgi:hypothetical protein